MKSFSRMKLVGVVYTGAMMLMPVQPPALAQFGPPPGPSGPARDIAPIDLTGQWVSIVTEDWRFRMVTPPKNDFPGLPLNAAARAVADAWDPERDIAEGNQCKSYGAGTITRVPGRLRISWDDDSTLEMETDAGRQTGLLHFDPPPTRPSRPGRRFASRMGIAQRPIRAAGCGRHAQGRHEGHEGGLLSQERCSV